LFWDFYLVLLWVVGRIYIQLIIGSFSWGLEFRIYHIINFFFFLELNYYVVYTLIFFAYMVGSSLLLLKGLNNDLRGFLLPWLIGMGSVVIFLLVWSIWLLYGYYIYVSSFHNIILLKIQFKHCYSWLIIIYYFDCLPFWHNPYEIHTYCFLKKQCFCLCIDKSWY